jgi:hypothetical protein
MFEQSTHLFADSKLSKDLLDKIRTKEDVRTRRSGLDMDHAEGQYIPHWRAYVRRT